MAIGSRPFSARPDLVRLADHIARRYGTDPWEVMRWTPERFGFALEAWMVAAGDKAKRMEEIGKNEKAMIFPIVNVLGD